MVVQLRRDSVIHLAPAGWDWDDRLMTAYRELDQSLRGRGSSKEIKQRTNAEELTGRIQTGVENRVQKTEIVSISKRRRDHLR